MAGRWKRVLVAVAMAGTAAAGLPATAQEATERLSPGLAGDVASLPPQTDYEAIVRFHEGPLSRHEPLLAALGLTVTGTLRAFPIAAVRGALSSVAALGHDAAVAYVEPNALLEYLGDTAIWATRVGVVQNTVSGGPYRTADNAVLDGNGIGVAIIDTGVDASHPDLRNRVKHYLPMGDDLPQGTNSDATSGHGTHISGIVAGDGSASQGTFKGVAPASTLHVFASGAVIAMFGELLALDTIYHNFDHFVPRIRVINNSWANPAGSAYNPEGAIEYIVKKLVEEKSTVVVFAAGNNGGDGSADRTSGYCKDPTPGVICVANYHDNETGDREGALDSTSSRADEGDASLYPDISAPGSIITSTFQPTSGALYGAFISPDVAWQPYYAEAGGTSMAAPHVAGIAALLVQAKPSLTPAQVEDILLDTAHKFSAGGTYEPDAQNPGKTTSYDKGAGLVDAAAALRDSRVGLTPNDDQLSKDLDLVGNDEGDVDLYGAADIVRATVTVSGTGLEYSVTVRDANQRPLTNVALRIISNVDGKGRRTTVILDPSGAVAAVGAESPDDPETAEATKVSRKGNTITFFVPKEELGGAASRSPVHNVQVASFVGAVQDVAPSPCGVPSHGPCEDLADTRKGADILLRPLYAPPFSVRG